MTRLKYMNRDKKFANKLCVRPRMEKIKPNKYKSREFKDYLINKSHQKNPPHWPDQKENPNKYI